ncbi:flagellar hook-length control protein FliK [Massilia sp. IC2-477]|uniref:flagellar hook-length control protein FliK n=1 Tax=Massilia sp. IC2-477 TaxID=2887198 RepID=UPI001D11CBEE|nr:flagellar hook-length control protein FliK [Massilia sp. IC2-477]MCC2956992.1 flagellar hook-length control protein FliK [Massilia sp. IC2-477]
MLPRELVSAVLRTGPVLPVEHLNDPRQQAFQRALAPQLGKALHGEVLAKLTDGSFVVKVANIPARMQLPAGAQVGADVPLTLVSVNPRPTFQVGTGANPVFSEAGPPLPKGADPGKAPLAMREGAAPQSGAAVGRAAALLQAGAAGAGAQSLGAEANNTTLSQAGKTIGGVLAAAQKAELPLSAALGRTPVVAAAGADAASIATGLQQAVGKSGLFYESHVAEWAQGARPMAELNAEPQQQLAREGVRQLPTDPATAQFINLQLATQEQAQLAWQGNLWPGQPMRLEVQRETREGHEEAGEPETSWHSRLRLHFPELGELDARLTLTGGRLQLQFAAGSADTAALLRRHVGSLAGALEAAGTQLAGFDVRAQADD